MNQNTDLDYLKSQIGLLLNLQAEQSRWNAMLAKRVEYLEGMNARNDFLLTKIIQDAAANQARMAANIIALENQITCLKK
jgi:hypothetical protein